MEKANGGKPLKNWFAEMELEFERNNSAKAWEIFQQGIPDIDPKEAFGEVLIFGTAGHFDSVGDIFYNPKGFNSKLKGNYPGPTNL